MVRSQLFYSLPDIGEGRAVARESQRYVQAISLLKTSRWSCRGLPVADTNRITGRHDVPRQKDCPVRFVEAHMGYAVTGHYQTPEAQSAPLYGVTLIHVPEGPGFAGARYSSPRSSGSTFSGSFSGKPIA